MRPSIATPQPKSPGLNVIALISGGKDSLYSILHCLRNGHKVVALANLHPAPPTTTSSGHGSSRADNEHGQEAEGEEDIDSFMYQTVGWSVIPLYETALGIPLYRAPIHGGAVDTARVYRSDAADQMAETNEGNERSGEEDETESLIPLLRRAKEAHPEANAVSAGAILSTYQRTRIENVAARLGLVPLAWLWMYPVLPAPGERRGLEAMVPGLGDVGLLEDMAAVGCEARIIKVASGSLDEGFLWGNVSGADGGLRRRIVKGVRRFAEGDDIRGAVLGEGGEYETLALDGPAFVWKKRIEIEEREVRMGQAGVGYVRLKGARCVPKTVGDGQPEVTPQSVRRPELLDDPFSAALAGLVEDWECVVASRGGQTVIEPVQWEPTEFSQSQDGATWMITNITAPEAGPGAAEQMAVIARKIQHLLDFSDGKNSPRTTADIVFTTVLLRSMADFPLMNSIYVSLFKKPNPPARATVACGNSLPKGVSVMVSMVVDMNPRDLRQGLHVQSRSYWAPANIGPYSQAMSIPLRDMERLVYIAGQIPLEPASMDLIGLPPLGGEQPRAEGYLSRAVLSLQHMWRIGTAMEVGWWLGVTAFFTGPDHAGTKARLAWKLWETMHERSNLEAEQEDDDSTLDAWDIKYGRREWEQTKPATISRLPNFDLVHTDAPVPVFFAVQVDELPKQSDIEWQGLGYQGEGMKINREVVPHGRITDVTTNGGLRYWCIEIDQGPQVSDVKPDIHRILETYFELKGASHCIIYTAQPLPQGACTGQIVPCKSVWGAEGRELAAGAIFQRQI